MTPFARRRIRNASVVGAAVLGLAAVLVALARGLHTGQFLSGWILLGLIFFLAAFHARKQVRMFPLGSAAGWLQAHVYAALLAAAVFGMHVGWRLPDGPLETLLAGLFAAVTLTGLGGLAISRVVPVRLTVRGPEVVYERIPALQHRLRGEAESKVLQSVGSARGSAPLADFYVRRLLPFFQEPRHFIRHLLQSRRPSTILLHRLHDLERYLDEEERALARELAELVRAKDDLDYQRAHQALLKGWLFAHIPLTWATLIFAVTHAVLAHAYAAGVR